MIGRIAGLLLSATFIVGGVGGCGGEPPVAPPLRPVAIVITASDTLTAPGHGLTFTAVGVDSAGRAVTSDPVTWSVSDTLRGRIGSNGAFTGGPWVGRLYVRATLDTPALAESVAVRIVPPGTVKWRWAISEVGGVTMPIVGGPALGRDGTVYVVVIPPQAASWYATLVALTSTGTLAWALTLEAVGDGYPVVTPAGDVLVTGKQVYVVRPDGTVRWQAMMDAISIFDNPSAIGDGVAFVAHGLNLSALTLATGDTVWQSPSARRWRVPPTVVGADRVYAKHTSDTLFAFRQTDGAILKTYQDSDSTINRAVFGVGTVPVDDRLYVPTPSRLVAFDTAGALLWMSDEWWNTAEPVVGHDGALYVQNSLGTYALDADGTVRWSRCDLLPYGRCGEEQRWNPYGGGALGAGGVFYGAGWDRFFAYDTAGTALWHYQADSAGVPQAFIGAPAIGPDGIVYTFTGTHVYAFWASAPPEPNSPWPMWRHDAQRTGWVR